MNRHAKTAIVPALFIVGLIVAVVLGLFANWKSTQETAAQRVIVNDVRGLVEECRKATGPIAIVGKAFVWDIRSDSPSGASGMLPQSRRASSTDTPITIFMVLGKRDEQVGTYSISNQPAYRQFLDVAVTYWPAKKAVGFHSIVSKEPPSSRTVRHVPEYGDPNEPIAKWIQTLPNTVASQASDAAKVE